MTRKKNRKQSKYNSDLCTNDPEELAVSNSHVPYDYATKTQVDLCESSRDKIKKLKEAVVKAWKRIANKKMWTVDSELVKQNLKEATEGLIKNSTDAMEVDCNITNVDNNLFRIDARLRVPTIIFEFEADEETAETLKKILGEINAE